MSDPVFQKEINNPLVDITGWEDHLALVVGVHQSYPLVGWRTIECFVGLKHLALSKSAMIDGMYGRYGN